MKSQKQIKNVKLLTKAKNKILSIDQLIGKRKKSTFITIIYTENISYIIANY